VGMTINCYLNRPHVQSMLWVTDFVPAPITLMQSDAELRSPHSAGRTFSRKRSSI
jgi:hypothetical protein